MHILLLHGAIGAADQLTPIAAALEQGFTAHTMDFSGHGKAPFPEEPFSIALFARDVLAYMDNHDMDKAAIFGYSMGGYVGMYLALHHSARIHKLATLATKFHWEPATAKRETQMINPEKIYEKVPAFAKVLEQRHQPKDWKNVLAHTAQLLTDLGNNPPLTPDVYPAITIPSLLLLGDNDRMVSFDETLTVFKNVPGAQLGILPATHHPIEQVDVGMLACLLRRFYQTNAASK